MLVSELIIQTVWSMMSCELLLMLLLVEFNINSRLPTFCCICNSLSPLHDRPHSLTHSVHSIHPFSPIYSSTKHLFPIFILHVSLELNYPQQSSRRLKPILSLYLKPVIWYKFNDLTTFDRAPCLVETKSVFSFFH